MTNECTCLANLMLHIFTVIHLAASVQCFYRLSNIFIRVGGVGRSPTQVLTRVTCGSNA